ncbi:hypothetical protein [Marinisporobacter balticus]|uniref:Uncharacterized protein n=1 Tax=Marinisporobacter balticus TaxID=2018667 RepID=A0A4R2KLK7_9FIRM|nr:hypothetical protein [Marinisporobacter balticus]TCO74563.1 hypothetical protein EV214_11240 [Marinisporobacter balticus]
MINTLSNDIKNRNIRSDRDVKLIAQLIRGIDMTLADRFLENIDADHQDSVLKLIDERMDFIKNGIKK